MDFGSQDDLVSLLLTAASLPNAACAEKELRSLACTKAVESGVNRVEREGLSVVVNSAAHPKCLPSRDCQLGHGHPMHRSWLVKEPSRV